MLGQLIIIDSSRKSVGGRENSEEPETYGHKKEPDYSGSFFILRLSLEFLDFV